jgi:hypothetical protein
VRVCGPINRHVTVEEASRIVTEKQTFFLPTEVCCCSSFPILLPSSSPNSGWVGGLSRLLTIGIRAYHRARGLCQYCTEKYVRGHKCAPTVQLQAVQELWGLFAVDSDSESGLGASDCEAPVNMLLSQEAVSSDCSANTLKFMGANPRECNGDFDRFREFTFVH